ncbi:MAG TPA: bifunctional DNA-formamidopyrimidine glycosylase/DNA-(apurinic or apyrimidinic site) lyase [Candidatus Acidoferrum sp.]|nr:bifunctional DNA-formamidopyrimidine glycosylase/DNA-(apurinic or apyrimidinic site) lyase [Candidatus Acidoferrum sp.]
MPELPEVEAVTQTVRPLIVGRKILCVHVFHPIATKPQSPASFVQAAQGQTIHAVARHGKYLVIELDRGVLAIHFRLDGRLLWFDSAKDLLARANCPPHKIHVDVALELDGGVLGFADRRHFGRVHFFASREACAGIQSLGVDALAREFTPQLFESLLAASRRPLKEFLLDQTRVAGIGNIYSAESMWHARLDPRLPASSLTAKESANLHKAIVSVLHRALECCLHPAPDFRDPNWWFEGLEKILFAYDREGRPCVRCGEPIERIEQGGRSTYFCKSCQK